MCRTCGQRHSSFDLDASPGSQDANVEGNGSVPFSMGLRSPGKVSPLRGRTMKEYEEQLGNLKKENFALKLRIYFLEESMGKKYDKEDQEHLYKANIELKVETEALKRELYDKQELVRQASSALNGLDQQYQDQLLQLKQQHQQAEHQLHHKVEQLEKEVTDYANRCNEEGGRLGELTQLCGLAFSTGDLEGEDSTLFPNSAIVHPLQEPRSQTLPLPLQSNRPASPSINVLSVSSPMPGVFSLAEENAECGRGPGTVPDTATMVPELAKIRIADLETQVEELQTKVQGLEEELALKQQTSELLEGDVINLKKELEERLEKVNELEAEVVEKDQKVDQLMQDLETRHMEIQDKESTIQTLHEDLNRVEPEIEVKVQEIVERDRIIEQKIEQIEQQNKILVEIQITLDEKQKQIAELEGSLHDANMRVKRLDEEVVEKSITIQLVNKEVEIRDKDIRSLKKEVKRLEKKCKDLVAELKEALDMLNKIKWEAETSGREDGVKEMVEEENERLWAELEQRKSEILALRTAHESAVQDACQRINDIQQSADFANKQLTTLQSDHDIIIQQHKQCDGNIKEKNEMIVRLEAELATLRGDLNSREGQLRSNQGIVEGLKEELTSTKQQLNDKRTELNTLQDELKRKNNDIQELLNRHLYRDSNKDVEMLQNKLSALTLGQMHNEVDAMKDQLQAAGTINLLRLQQQSNTQSPVENVHTVMVPGSEHGNTTHIVHMTQVTNNVPDGSNSSQLPVQPQSQIQSQLPVQPQVLIPTPQPQEEVLISSQPPPQHAHNTSQPQQQTYVPSQPQQQSFVISQPQHQQAFVPTPQHQQALVPSQLQQQPFNTSQSEQEALVPSQLQQQPFNTSQSEQEALIPSQSQQQALIPSQSQQEAPPVQVTINNDNATIQLLYQEMGKIRCEAQALKQERMVLNDKLIGLQQLNKQVCENVNDTEAKEIKDQMEILQKQLDESKEENVLKDQKHVQIVNEFQGKIEILRGELSNAKKKITQQLSEMSVRKYQETIKRFKQEVASLRKRLADSHNACDLLRNRLEELVDFLERILEMDKEGLINLSQFSTQEMASLHQSLNESRALSQTLSQSLMIGMDSALGDQFGPEDNGLSSSISSVSSFSLHRDDSLSEVPEAILGSSQEALSSLSDDHLLGNMTVNDSICPNLGAPDADYQALASRLTAEIDMKGKEIDGIADKVSTLSDQLDERISEIENQACVIIELRDEIRKLREEINLKDSQLHVKNCTSPSALDAQAFNSIALNAHLDAQNSLLSQTMPETRAGSSQSTLHARSPSADLGLSQASATSQELLHISSCSDTLPPPPHMLLTNRKDSVIPTIVHTEQEFELCQQPSDNSSISAVRSAYSTDVAIKAHSNNPEYFQKLTVPLECSAAEVKVNNKGECVSASGALEQPPAWTLLSPSESEAWSEPDRNVSLARIGLDTCTLAASLDRSLSRSRQTRTSAAFSSESEAEAVAEEVAVGSGGVAPTSNKVIKRRSEGAEIRRLSAKLRNIEQLNETLKAELNIYQTLSQQMVASQDRNNAERYKQSMSPRTSDKSVETHKGETVDAAVRASEESYHIPILPAPLLEEIRALRIKLEEAIANNDHLRDQLEAAIAVHPNEDPRIHHLTVTLHATAEQLQLAHEKIALSYKSEVLQNHQLVELRDKLEEKKEQNRQQTSHLESIKVELGQLKKELHDGRIVITDKDTLLRERNVCLAVANEYTNECDLKLAEQDEVIRNLCDNIKQLQQSSQTEILEERNKILAESLQACETQLLNVTKERISLVGERTLLLAQTAAITAQAQFDKDQLLDDDNGQTILLDQLRTRQDAITSLEQERQKLLSEQNLHDKQRQLMQEEISSIRSQLDHRITRDAMSHGQINDHDFTIIRTTHLQLQHRYSNLQDNYTSLQRDVARLEEELSNLRKENRELNTSICRINEHEARIRQLSAQLDSERQLTVNLQLQLDSIQNRRHSSSPNTDTLQDVSDLASPGSATSFEFFRPEAAEITSRPKRPTSLGPLKERGSSGSRRREGSRSLRSSEYWSDNKENFHTSTTTLTSMSNSTTVTRKSRRNNSIPSDNLLILPENLNLKNNNISTTRVDDPEDDTKTSGESPDLGIGSDCHFSSLERGTRTLRTLVAQTQNHQNNSLEKLCSDPNHSCLSVDNEHLRHECEHLSDKLAATKDTLQDALNQLSRANQRKETVERAIYKQLTKTHDVLRKAKGNLKQANTSSSGAKP